MTRRPGWEATHTATWLDLDYDRAYASDGRSRYGAYLRDRAWWWADDYPRLDGDAVRVLSAGRCWEIANGPIMAPGLVLTHPRVLSALAVPDEYDGRHLVVTVNLVAGLPAELRSLLGGRWRGWQYERAGFGESYWAEPHNRDGRPVRAALPTLALSWPVPAAELPPMPGDVPDVGEAIEAVSAVAGVLNRELRPVLAALAGDR
jgi:hypothetical protein